MDQTNSAKIWSSTIPAALMERAVVAALKKLNLVPRADFDIQTKVLQRTREKIERLEQKIAVLEQTNSSKK